MADHRSAPAAWQCGSFRLPLERPLLMGILNITPDSFSDGGRHGDVASGLAHARMMIAAGADMIDVGGESTRPGSDEVLPAEEMQRVGRVVQTLARSGETPISVDTRHPSVARACVDAGASVINDVSGFRDPAMVEVATSCDAGVVIMHMLGEPKTMQAEPVYSDVVAEVREYLATQAATLEAAGVAGERIAIDPGIGFGKTAEHNLELLRRLPELASLGYTLLVGASRKAFIGRYTGEPDPRRRVAGSVTVAEWCAWHGANVLRVHDVAETRQALAMRSTLEGRGDG